MFNQVFISHAKEDYETAEKIYKYLQQNGYSPWLDKKQIKVGENWDLAIKKALRESTFVIFLLSSTSINKRGYVQKEFNLALTYAQEKLRNDIYIIPILLDACKVPEHLSTYQWIEITEKNFMKEILSSLNKQRKIYLYDKSEKQVGIPTYTTISIDHDMNVSPDFDYSCELPLFNDNSYFNAKFVNTFIQQKALEVISQIRSIMVETDKVDDFYLEISFYITQLNDKFLSLSLTFNSFLGGAHPNTNVSTLNFSFRPDRILKLYDLVMYDNLHKFLKKLLKKYGDKHQKVSLKENIKYLTDEDIDFNFDSEVLEINFMNIIPRSAMAFSWLQVPLKNLKLRI